MSDQQTLTKSRFGWFRRSAKSQQPAAITDDAATLAAAEELASLNDNEHAEPATATFTVGGENGQELPTDAGTALAPAQPQPAEHRSTFLRPWAKRDQAIENLQAGVGALAELMDGIRGHLERQSARQDEMIQYLAHLPEALKSIPEGSRMQAAALKAIHTQMERQTSNQTQLASILDKITQADGRNGRTLDALQEHVGAIRSHDAAISRSLTDVGEAMTSMSMNSEVSTGVLRQLRDNIVVRDNDLEKVLQRQGSRFSAMLAVAIFVSVTALTVAGVVGYLAFEAMKQLR